MFCHNSILQCTCEVPALIRRFAYFLLSVMYFFDTIKWKEALLYFYIMVTFGVLSSIYIG